MKKRQQGLTTVEAAIGAALMLILLFGAIEVSRAIFVYNFLDEVTRRGARVAAVCPFNHPGIREAAVFADALDGTIDTQSPHVGQLQTSDVRIEYLDAAFCANEPVLAKQQLVDMWCARLGVTEDESDFAYEQGNKAMAAFDREMEEMGLQVLTRAERDHRICLLVLCRPYHLDRGLNHGVLEDFQALGYPVLTLRSLPKKPAWLERFFRDAKGEACPNPLDIGDVWRESNNSNSALKVWGAKFAARHPNVAILDLSSFKCGHDAPIYGIVDNIVNTAHAPYSALHDIDANKPSGSIKIRVKTYAHSLRRRQEQLEARAASQGFTHRPPLATQHSSQWGDITRLDSSPTVSVPIVEPQPV